MMIRERRGPWWRARAAILREWIVQAAERAPDGWALKTDLFDEASGPHHHAGDLDPRHRFLGVDSSLEVARAAQRRLDQEGRRAQIVVCDVRALPFASDSMALVVSLSTLDHFPSCEGIGMSLTELARAMRPAGIVLLTLDNPRNPEVALRAGLPERMVRWLRADSFPLGFTPQPSDAERFFALAGLTTLKRGFMVHAPRYPLMRMGERLERISKAGLVDRLERLILGLESASNLPVSPLSGHYAGWILTPREGE